MSIGVGLQTQVAEGEAKIKWVARAEEERRRGGSQGEAWLSARASGGRRGAVGAHGGEIQRTSGNECVFRSREFVGNDIEEIVSDLVDSFAGRG